MDNPSQRRTVNQNTVSWNLSRLKQIISLRLRVIQIVHLVQPIEIAQICFALHVSIRDLVLIAAMDKT